jgi:hypothetical protein
MSPAVRREETREMRFMQDNGERLLRFHVLYTAALKQDFDREEFVADDLYAFQALERAMRSGNQELRNIAAHLQAQRQAEMESITLKSMEGLDSTRRLSSLNPESSRDGLPHDPEPPLLPEGEIKERLAAAGADLKKALAARRSQKEPGAEEEPASKSGAAAGAGGERRSGGHRLSPQEITRVTYLQRLYRQEFGKPLNVARFTMDDSYGRSILKEALGASNKELVQVARHFIDENGKPRQHRRGLASSATL